MSSIGGDQSNNNNGNGRNNNNKNPLDEFLDPSNSNNESDDLDREKTRQSRIDTRLPINFRSDDGSRDSEFFDDENGTDTVSPLSDALVPSFSSSSVTQEKLEKNPYLEIISRLTPSEMILRFTSSAHPRVQDAVKNTILGLVGSLPRESFDTRAVATADRLASLMFQLQMTGYMFKNAEYRMAIMKGKDRLEDSRFLLQEGQQKTGDNEMDIDDFIDTLEDRKVRGKIRVNFNGSSDPSEGLEVEASSYLAELRSKVRRLKEELAENVKTTNDQDLLGYVRSLPPQEMKELTSTITEDVLVAMKGLVNGVLIGIAGVDQDDEEPSVTIDTMLEQSGEAMAQLCMWQIVAGYNMRELEVREEMKESLNQVKDDMKESNSE